MWSKQTPGYCVFRLYKNDIFRCKIDFNLQIDIGKKNTNLPFFVHSYVLQGGQVVRISFSNMLKEFKSTATWLQFPFLCGAAKDSVDEFTSRTTKHGRFCSYRSRMPQAITLPMFYWIILYGLVNCFCFLGHKWDAGMLGRAPASVRWTCLMIDLQFTLSVYLNRHYSHLKSIKLCANMAVKNMFTSDLLLDPGEN